MRPKTWSALDKTYQDCLQLCTTAVYFEGQNNEAEALRFWRSALDQIYYHNAYRVPRDYRPASETEKALQDSLREMELQCKERVDLLEALRESRNDASQVSPSASSSDPATASASTGRLQPQPHQYPPYLQQQQQQQRFSAPQSPSEGMPGWLGDGTIPPVAYSDISRPPPLPHRPAMLSRHSSGNNSADPTNNNKNYLQLQQQQGGRSQSLPQNSSSSTLAASSQKPSRTPSPEKKTGLLRTLRTGGKDGRHDRRMPNTLKPRQPPAAAKAASQAWGVTAGLPPVSRRFVTSGPPTVTTTGEKELPLPPQSLLVGAASSSSLNVDAASAHDAGQDARTRSLDSASKGERAAAQAKRNYREKERQKPSRSFDIPRKDQERVRERTPRPKASGIQPDDLAAKSASRALRLDATVPAAGRGPGNNPARKGAVKRHDVGVGSSRPTRVPNARDSSPPLSDSSGEEPDNAPKRPRGRQPPRVHAQHEPSSEPGTPSSEEDVAAAESDEQPEDYESPADKAWKARVDHAMRHLPRSVDETAARQIVNEIVIQGDDVRWDDIAGLTAAKAALKEAVVYPFLRPDLFSGLREPARGMLLFGPPGTGKTMLARAVATESRSTFFAISASSLTSKFLGESEKLVRALFALARALAPAIIFVDEIDSLLSSRGNAAGEHEASRRIKTEFLIQWSDLAKAAAGREPTERDKERGDASRVLVLAATNMPWAIDEAARRRFVRRQYIPLPEEDVRMQQLRTLLGHQKHEVSEEEMKELVRLTDGFSGSDITALAKDAAMGPLRSLGERLLEMSMDEIRPIRFEDFQASLANIRPSVSKQGLKQFEAWAKEFGERGG
ncbi:P-loop containing nucleoside triphosphate hydrolase protein [Lineolata rhizophorae]|uniref:P-loop containing nucleoside triphosphate hydrolase protein n=1 Tax=Lineolata rhizophorae TaxID=578093 RepID=A0A6A6P6X5_9PEZI|nr:P-loop containing nucleoside triphosphate hydrolase protein [Lineolata rhizophorae]